jgi:hypothetical protein
MRRLCMGLLGAALFAAPALADDAVQLSRTVWADYEIYLKHLGPGGTGFYAVTPDGLGGAASGCAPAKCHIGPATRAAAIARCREVSPPSLDCIIFAEGDRIEVDYELRDY